MNFKYYYATTVMADIDIDDIGHCAIEAHNDIGEFWYLVIRSELGSTQIFEYGPTCHMDVLEKAVNCSFRRIEFNEKKINKAIDSFLNNPYRNITCAEEIEISEALNNCDDILGYMKTKHF